MYKIFTLPLLFMIIGCSTSVRWDNLITIKDYYDRGVEYSINKEYEKAIQTFKKGMSIGDAIEDEYYVSMSEYEIAFNRMLQGRDKEALYHINNILSQLISSKKPRILAEQLRQKIEQNQQYRNATY